MSKKWYALLLVFLTMILGGCSVKTASTDPADTREVLTTAVTPQENAESEESEPAQESPEPTQESPEPAQESAAEQTKQTPTETDYVRDLDQPVTVQPYEVPSTLQILEPETLSHDAYFSKVRSEDRDGGIGSEVKTGEQLKETSCTYTDDIENGNYKRTIISEWPKYYRLPDDIEDDKCYLVRDKFMSVGMRHYNILLSLVELPVENVVNYEMHHYYTLRRLYLMTDGGAALTQFDLASGVATDIYRTSQTLGSIYCGANIVLFSEQNADGTWRVLRLYEPDGTIDVIEESIPTEPSLSIISNCEYVIGWKNPAYAVLEEELAPYYWKAAGYDFRIPEYPGKEVTKYITDFDQILPQLIYGDHGIFDYYVRYRNTLTGKTVTLGRTPRSAIFYTYIRPDGSEWELSAERVEYEDGQYNMIRFWLYLPANDTDGGFKATEPRPSMPGLLQRQTVPLQENVQNEYYSQICDEDMTDTDSLWDGYELRYNSDARLLSLFQERGMAEKRAGDEIKIPIADVSDGSDGLFRRQVYGRTLRRVYAICERDRRLMSFEPQNYTLTELYRTEGKLTELVCGQNIVVFVEQMADGTWRVLRLYEPDGTVDVIEENLSEVAEIKIISNCEFVTRWKNPAYQAVEDANVAAIWADWAPEDGPYPGREEADRISNFHEVLPEDVFDRTGVFNYYSRYRNTLSGKTVTVGCIVGCAPLHDYCLLDGTPWTISNERRYADWEKYDMPRFWLYLPADK